MIPELIPVNDDRAAPVPPPPVEAEDMAERQLLEEFAKLDAAPEPPDADSQAVMTGLQQLTQALPELLKLLGMFQQTQALLTQAMSFIKKNHDGLHVLQKKVAVLENAMVSHGWPLSGELPLPSHIDFQEEQRRLQEETELQRKMQEDLQEEMDVAEAMTPKGWPEPGKVNFETVLRSPEEIEDSQDVGTNQQPTDAGGDSGETDA